MSDILDTILAVKADEVRALRRRYTEQDLLELARGADPVRGFAAALERAAGEGAGVIAEIKRASPSKGLIREDFDPRWLAEQYAEGGAACLSVLTDQQFFQGAVAYLEQAREACELPVLRKDFMVAPAQVVEARAIGADCILLIAAALSAMQMRDLAQCAVEQQLDVLVEVHDDEELRLVLEAGLPEGWMLGINNRNLRTFETRLETTLDMLADVPAGTPVVTESGITGWEDMARMADAEVRRFLIGETLMRQPEPGPVLKEWLARLR